MLCLIRLFDFPLTADGGASKSRGLHIFHLPTLVVTGRVGMRGHAVQAESAYTSSPGTRNSLSLKSEGGGSTVVSLQPVSHPGMMFVPPRVDQEAERIRGGCCPCPGGGFWVCGTEKKDDEFVEQRQRELQAREAEAARSTAPAQPLPLLQLPASGLPASGPSRTPRPSKATKPSTPQTLSPPEGVPPPVPQTSQARPTRRTPAVTLPAQPPPRLPVPVSGRTPGRRAQSVSAGSPSGPPRR